MITLPALTPKVKTSMKAMDDKPSQTTSLTPNKDETKAPVTKKKPYVKPGFRMEKVFVTTALSCGKVNDGTGDIAQATPIADPVVCRRSPTAKHCGHSPSLLA